VLELKGLDQLGVRPAARADNFSRRPGCRTEVVGHKLLDDAMIAGLVRTGALAYELQAVMGSNAPLLSRRIDGEELYD
jgi:hypothetical protein